MFTPITTGIENGGERVLERLLSKSAFANADVCNQAKQSAAPIGSPPGVGTVESSVTISGKTLGHITHQVVPHALDVQGPGARARKRLEVGRKPLFEPQVRFVEIRAGEMEHLMGEHPIVVEILLASMRAQRDTDASTSVGDTVLDS